MVDDIAGVHAPTNRGGEVETFYGKQHLISWVSLTFPESRKEILWKNYRNV